MKSQMRMNWGGDNIKRQVYAEMRGRVKAASIAVSVHAKELVNQEGTASRWRAGRRVRKWVTEAKFFASKAKSVKATRTRDGEAQVFSGRYKRARKGSLIYGANPSRPGDPPHKQRGRLKGSIAFEMMSGFIGRVGTNLKYGRWLELGTKRMAARPWLRRALYEMSPRIRALMTKPFSLKDAV